MKKVDFGRRKMWREEGGETLCEKEKLITL
jgi:hypothetical protein